jgi:hypothetical protein
MEERKKYEQYLGGFLEWRRGIVKPKQRIPIVTTKVSLTDHQQ